MVEESYILVVDDDPVFRDGIEAVLERYGYVVETAANGAEALARLERGPLPEVVLLDLAMPVMRGEEVARTIEEHPVYSAMAVVLCTGEASSSLGRVPADAFLPKPIAPGDLVSTVQRVVARRRRTRKALS